MFQSLSDKLNSAFKKFRSKGRLTEADVKAGMREEPGCIRKALEIFEDFEINIDQIPCSIVTFSFIVRESAIKDKLHAVMSRLEQQLAPDSVKIVNNISLIAVVGRNLSRNVGIAGKIFTALGEAGVNIRVISQGADEVNIMIGVDNEDYKKAICVLHDF